MRKKHFPENMVPYTDLKSHLHSFSSCFTIARPKLQKGLKLQAFKAFSNGSPNQAGEVDACGIPAYAPSGDDH